MLLKPPPTPVTVPASALVMFQVLATLSAVKLLMPVTPPSIAPLKVPPLKVKLSVPVPPVRLPILLKPPAIPVTVPLSRPVITQLFATLSAVKLLVPAAPPLNAPLKVPPLKVKSSLLLPPVRLLKPLNVTPFTVPASAPVIIQLFATSAPTSVPLAPLPVTVSMLVKLVSILATTAPVTAE